jgi:hypothetical protein
MIYNNMAALVEAVPLLLEGGETVALAEEGASAGGLFKGVGGFFKNMFKPTHLVGGLVGASLIKDVFHGGKTTKAVLDTPSNIIKGVNKLTNPEEKGNVFDFTQSILSIFSNPLIPIGFGVLILLLILR